MKSRTWILVVAAVVVAVMACAFILLRPAAEPTNRPTRPVPTATLRPPSTPAPSSTPSEPLPADAAGCSEYGPGSACEELQPPERITAAQAAATTTARRAVIAYAQYDPSGAAAWRSRLQPLLAPGVELEVTALARRDSALSDLKATTKIDQARTVQAYVDGVDEDGRWQFTVNATAVARYVDATGTVSYWTVPGTWTVTIDPRSKLVTDITEDTPALDDAL